MPRTVPTALLLGLTLAVGACAIEPTPISTPEPPPPAKVESKPLLRDGNTALTESLRTALIRAQEALKDGKIDAAAYERILLSHQRTITTMAAIQALGWGNYPPPQPMATGVTPRPPTRVEAIERLTEMLYRQDVEAKPRPNPRR